MDTPEQCFICKLDECDESDTRCWLGQALRMKRRRVKPTLPEGYVTIVQYANERGITSQAVCNQIRKGKMKALPTMVGNRIRRLVPAISQKQIMEARNAQ